MQELDRDNFIPVARRIDNLTQIGLFLGIIDNRPFILQSGDNPPLRIPPLIGKYQITPLTHAAAVLLFFYLTAHLVIKHGNSPLVHILHIFIFTSRHQVVIRHLQLIMISHARSAKLYNGLYRRRVPIQISLPRKRRTKRPLHKLRIVVKMVIHQPHILHIQHISGTNGRSVQITSHNLRTMSHLYFIRLGRLHRTCPGNRHLGFQFVLSEIDIQCCGPVLQICIDDLIPIFPHRRKCPPAFQIFPDRIIRKLQRFIKTNLYRLTGRLRIKSQVDFHAGNTQLMLCKTRIRTLHSVRRRRRHADINAISRTPCQRNLRV